jgi:hypothetical protein
MNKLITTLAVVASFAGLAMADSASVTLRTLAVQSYSDPIPASGWLDRIEISAGTNSHAAMTNVVAIYDGTNIVMTLHTGTLGATTISQTSRPRLIGTTTAGVDLVGVAGTSSTTSMVTVLTAPYERIMLGGNIRFSILGCGTTNESVTCRVYFEPTKK